MSLRSLSHRRYVWGCSRRTLSPERSVVISHLQSLVGADKYHRPWAVPPASLCNALCTPGCLLRQDFRTWFTNTHVHSDLTAGSRTEPLPFHAPSIAREPVSCPCSSEAWKFTVQCVPRGRGRLSSTLRSPLKSPSLGSSGGTSRLLLLELVESQDSQHLTATKSASSQSLSLK